MPGRVRKRRLHLNVPGGLVDDRVERRDAPGGLDAGAVTRRDPDPVPHADLADILLRHAEVHVYRMQRLQRHHSVAGREVLTEVDQTNAEDAVEWGADRLSLDRRVDFAEPRVGLFLIRCGAVEFRLRDHPVGQQPFQPVVIETRKLPLRLDCGQLRPLLARVQLREDVSLAHGPARLERHAGDGARQIGADRHALDRGNGSDRAQRRRPFFLLRDEGGHSLRRWLKGGALRDGCLNLPEFHEAEQSDHEERHPEHHNHPFRHELLLRRARTGRQLPVR